METTDSDSHKGLWFRRFHCRRGCYTTTFTTDEELAQQRVTLEYLTWKRQDQLLASWIISLLSEGNFVLIVGLSTFKEIWHVLETKFASQSRAKLMQYKLQLQILKKGNMNMREFFNKVKSCCDVLASVGHRISDEAQILHILSGLGSEYGSVMVSITSRIEPCSIADVHALLLSFESRLESFSTLWSMLMAHSHQWILLFKIYRRDQPKWFSEYEEQTTLIQWRELQGW